MRFEGKKLLVLGGFAMLMEAVEWAKSEGAYTIVTDYYPTSPAKAIADESWDISTADIELLASRCKAIGVDGVFAAFDDFNVGKAAELSEVLGLPFYASSKQTVETMDKSHFKANCIKYGVPTTPLVDIDGVNPSELPYPIIVKPVDGSASRGIKVCYGPDDLDEALEKAKKTSKSSHYLVEKYLVGDEVGTNYFLQDGVISASALHDRYLQEKNISEVKLPLAYVYPSKYTKHYLEAENKAVIKMFEALGMKNGSLFLQGCVDRDGTVYYYEMGYRLNGAKQYQIISGECGFNPMHCLINYSLTGRMADDDVASKATPEWGSVYCTLSLLVRPGKVDKVMGLDAIGAEPTTVAITQWCFPGNILDDSVLGTQKQIAARVTIKAKDYVELADSINKVNDLFDVLDDEGNSMILEQFDTDRLFV